MKMKKVIAVLMCVVTLFTLSVNVFAAESDFVPSIEQKGAPTIVPIIGDTIGYIVNENDEELSEEHIDCIIITPVSEANTSTEIPEDAKKVLLDAYNDILENGTKVFSDLNDDSMVVRDLFDITAVCDDVKQFLPVDGNTIDLKFDIGVAASVEVAGYVLVAGEWIKLPVTNNGDGTVSANFEEFGVVAFLVDSESLTDSPETGDVLGNDLMLWVCVMAVSFALIVVLVFVLRRQNKSIR